MTLDHTAVEDVLPPPTEAGPVARPRDGSGWWIALAGMYAAGVLVLMVQFLLDRRSLQRLAREGTEVRDEGWTRLLDECAARLRVRRPVRLLRSRERSMPMAFGTRQPTIVVPAIADTWAEDRRRAVVLHEMAHVARYDCLTQTLAFAACAMYWFHPAAWWAARRLRVERELACDDRVIAAAGRAREYADHLLEIAYAFGGDRAPALAVSMARPRQLEGRMLAALDAARNRNVPEWPVRLAGAVIAVALFLPVATATSAVRHRAEEPRRRRSRASDVTRRTSSRLASPAVTGLRPRVGNAARRPGRRRHVGDSAHGHGGNGTPATDRARIPPRDRMSASSS